MISTSIRDAANRDCLDELVIGDFDIPAAFINGLDLPRSMTGG